MFYYWAEELIVQILPVHRELGVFAHLFLLTTSSIVISNLVTGPIHTVY